MKRKLIENKEIINIHTAEEAKEIFWYIAEQLQKMSLLIKTFTFQECLKHDLKIQESDQQKAGIKKRKVTINEIKECQENISKALIGLNDFAKTSIILSLDADIFEYIEEWTDSVIKSCTRYDNFKKKILNINKITLPDITEEYNRYKTSIQSINTVLDTINKRDVQADNLIPLCKEL